MEEYAHFWERHKTISCYYAALTRAACAGTGLTQMEYDIIMFLHYHPQLNTAADMVKIRKATKSHVSTALKNLEDRGFIEKRQCKSNKRCNEIFLLAPAQEIIAVGTQLHHDFMHQLLEGIDRKDLDVFLDVFENMCANAEKGLMKVGISTCAESCAAGAPAQATSCSTAELNQAKTTPKTDWTH